MTRLRLSALARTDIVELLAWTTEHFGDRAAARYEHLLSAVLRALIRQPLLPGSVARSELGNDVRSFHLRHRRKPARVARPRHLILYRITRDSVVEVGRVLHDAMDLERYALFDFPPER